MLFFLLHIEPLRTQGWVVRSIFEINHVYLRGHKMLIFGRNFTTLVGMGEGRLTSFKSYEPMKSLYITN